MKKNKNVIIFSDTHDWHSNQLKKELKKLSCKISCLSLDDCFISTNNKNNIFIPGFTNNLPDGCFVRTIGKGTFQQITRRLTILHALKKLKVIIFNDVNCIEKTTDKSMTTFLLSHGKIDTPNTWVPEKLKSARNVLKKLRKKKYYGIWKPLFGSQGKGIKIIKNKKINKNSERVYYIQKYEDIKIKSKKEWQDFRILVCNNQIIASMIRKNKKKITNIGQGGKPFNFQANKKIKKISLIASKLVNADYAGIDLIKDKHGDFKIVEINSIPAWKGLQKISKKNIAAILAKAFTDKINKKNI
jgi:RimK family alpha-L-glutamate ligase